MTKVAECDSGNKLQTFTCNYVAKPRECWNILVTTLVASVAIAGFSLVLWDVTLSSEKENLQTDYIREEIIKVQTQLDDLKHHQNELKMENQMTVEAIDKLQVENQELQEKAKELMIKNDEQQLQIEGYQQMLAEAVDKLEIENQELKNETEKLTIENANQQTEIKDLTDFAYPPFPTCAHINSTADFPSGTYRVSPLGKQILSTQVYCNFAESQPETIIQHNFPNEVDAGDCDPARCARHSVVYDVTMEQIIALIEHSAECRQFIKYRCTDSVMFENSNPTYATWLSRDGARQIYWGGATSNRGRYCACGETSSCVDNRWKCNCDDNSKTETSDEGFLTDKDKLPVTGLQFGDLDDSGEAGWFTLGPLVCSGRAV